VFVFQLLSLYFCGRFQASEYFTRSQWSAYYSSWWYSNKMK